MVEIHSSDTEQLREKLIQRVRDVVSDIPNVPRPKTETIENAVAIIAAMPLELLPTLDNEGGIATDEWATISLWWPGKVHDAIVGVGQSGFSMYAKTPQAEYMVSASPTDDAALQTLFKAVSELSLTTGGENG